MNTTEKIYIIRASKPYCNIWEFFLTFCCFNKQFFILFYLHRYCGPKFEYMCSRRWSPPLSRVAFRILVVHAGAQRLQDGPAGKVFRGNQLQAVRLPLLLLLDDAKDLRTRGEEEMWLARTQQRLLHPLWVASVLFCNAVNANLRVAAGQRLQHHLVVGLPRLLAHNVSVRQRHGGRSVAWAGDSSVSIVIHNICKQFFFFCQPNTRSNILTQFQI